MCAVHKESANPRIRESGSARDCFAIHLVLSGRNQLFVKVCNAAALAPCYDEFNYRVRPTADIPLFSHLEATHENPLCFVRPGVPVID
jgi:hypothetical protein